MNEVAILIIDDDEASQAALRHVLDSDGWTLRVVPLAHQALTELASGNWTLVIVNVAMTGLEGPLYLTLKELALAPPVEEGHTRARVLFLVPELAGPEAQPILEEERVPYALKPFHLHDFLEKVSDLLLEINAIPAPIRRIRHEAKDQELIGGPECRTAGDRRSGRDRRAPEMFASRKEYVMSEDEIAEFEKQEEEERKKKEKREKELKELGRL